ncbi:MAG: oxaloacetate decarboxylase [Beijerinckiaceae bacterium]
MSNLADKKAALAQRIRSKTFTALPGVFEMISARIADGMGFEGIYMTGYGAVASHLGLPDAGLATYTDMVGRVARIVENTTTPLIADGDTGYGGLLNVEHTVRGYEKAGAAGIQLEDQVFPKKCGHTPGRPVVSLEEAAAKIRVAAASRDSKDFLIIARTDARNLHGLDEALRRAEAFAKAGADILFVEAPESREEMEKICKAFHQPLLANMVEGGKTPVLTAKELQDIGYTIGLFPTIGFLSMGAAVREAYSYLREHGSSAGIKTPLHDFQQFSLLMGFQNVWDFEKKWAGAEDGKGGAA